MRDQRGQAVTDFSSDRVGAKSPVPTGPLVITRTLPAIPIPIDRFQG